MKTEFVQVRCSKIEKLNMKLNAKRYGFTLSTYLKFLNAKENQYDRGDKVNEKMD